MLKPGSTEPLAVSTAAPANNTWTRLQVTYTLPSGSAYASVLPFLQNTSGTAAYFDALQLEQTASPSRYNLVENSDFSFNSAWTPNSSCASTDQIITYTSSPTENSDKRVMRITGDPNKHKYGNQILSGLGGGRRRCIYGGRLGQGRLRIYGRQQSPDVCPDGAILLHRWHHKR